MPRFSTILRRAVPLLAVALAVPPIAAPQAMFNAVAPRPHEAIDYSIEWRLITAGRARLEWNATPNTAPGAGNVRLHIESAGLVNRLYPVSDDYTAALSAGFCAQNSRIQASEGGRHKDTHVLYDIPAHKATFTERDLNKNVTVMHEVGIPACVHDLIGGLTALRYLHLEPGKSTQMPVSDGKKFVQARVEAQRHETLKTEIGVVNTTLYEIYLFDNIMFRRSGHLHIWITDDERRIPVQLEVRLQLVIGTITFRLDKYTPDTGGK